MHGNIVSLRIRCTTCSNVLDDGRPVRYGSLRLSLKERVFRRAFLLAVWLLFMASGGNLHAAYYGKNEFKSYDPEGEYPTWEIGDFNLDPRISLDALGLPVVRYATGRSYNPVTVAFFGLRAFNRWKATGKGSDREYFMKTTRWLVRTQDIPTGCWFYDFDYPYVTIGETLRKPWVSAMAQGLAISNLVRAYRLTGDETFLEVAERALKPFSIPVEQGGVLRTFNGLLMAGPPSDLAFYEEYPIRDAPSYALNGFLFALLGLYDFASVPNAEADKLFQRGKLTLRMILPFYDLGDLSAYDLGHLTHPPRKTNKSLDYHLVHIILLNALYSAANDPVLAWYRDQWNSYGTRFGPYEVFFRRVGVWVVRGHPIASGSALAVMFVVLTAGLIVIRRTRTT